LSTVADTFSKAERANQSALSSKMDGFGY